jgi:RND superfamily putative drug exporter
LRAPTRRLFIGEIADGGADKEINQRVAAGFRQAEVRSLPVTLLILVLAFGALVAASLPLLLGITAVAAALGLTELVSHLLHVDSSIRSVILLRCAGIERGLASASPRARRRGQLEVR